MSEKEKLEILEEVFDCEPGELAADTVLADLESWDSMTKLALIVAMDEQCGKKLDGSTISGFKTVSDILAFMG